MLLSLFIVSVFILVVSEVGEEKKQKKIQSRNMIFKKNLHVKK